MYINPTNPTNPYAFTPLQTTANVTPFTLRDGASFLEKLEALAKYSVETLPASFADKFVEVVAEFNKSLDATGTVWADDFAAYRADLTGVLAGLNDESVQLLTDNPDSKTGAAIRKLIVMLSASDADLEAMNEVITGAVTEVAAQRKTLDDHSSRHEYKGVDRLSIDVRQLVSPVRDWARGMLRNSSFAPFRMVFTGDSHTNDGSLEQWANQDDIWGGGTGYSYRIGNLLTNEGIVPCQAGQTVTTKNSPGAHVWESATGGMRSTTFMPQGTIDNIGKIQPHLVTLLIGTNDFAAQLSPSSFRNNVDNAISAIWGVAPEARVMLIVPFPRVNPSTVTYQWRDYANALRDIGEANKTNDRFELFDYGMLYERISSPLYPNMWGVFPDSIHGDIRVHRDLAERLAEWFGLPSPLAVFGPTRTIVGQLPRSGRLSHANPHSAINVPATAVPQRVTVHVNILGVVDDETDISLNVLENFDDGFIGQIFPFHVQPASLRSYSFTRTLYVPAHKKRFIYLSGGNGFNAYGGDTYFNYPQFFAELNYA